MHVVELNILDVHALLPNVSWGLVHESHCDTRQIWHEVDLRACKHAERHTQCVCLYFTDAATELLIQEQKAEDDIMVTIPVQKYFKRSLLCSDFLPFSQLQES